MKSEASSKWTWIFVGLAVLCLTFTLSSTAQVKTETTETAHEPTIETSVERAEVVLVEGTDLVLKMEDGSLRHLANVPESDRISVDGKELGIHDLKPGMKLEKTLKVITTPKTITTVQTVSGKVFHVSPPTSVILSLADGSNQQFKIPKDQKFNVHGEMVDAWGLKKGMNVTATKIVEEPVTEVEHQKQITGQMPPPPPAPPADQPIIVALVKMPENPPPAPAELPKTATALPLLGLLGFLSVVSGLGLKGIRAAIT
jgi:hypothetical protein